MPPNKNRAGRFVTQPSGYRAFIPAPLPPEPPVEVQNDILSLLSKADIATGRLDGIVKVVPDPDIFVGMYVRREAVLSSQIEGTQSTLEDLLEVELEPDRQGRYADVGDIVNYIGAMSYGLERINELPLSLRLIREIHGELLRDGRGAHATPGEFRTTQNWIGPSGASLQQATFVPPPVPEMREALGDFEQFLHNDEDRPVLLDVGLAHAQFETIHPFLDGNGRVGRLLITFLLVHRSVLRRPLLYLSYYFKLHRAEYYDRLTAVRQHGDWEGWLRFFLRGVAATADEATDTAEHIFELRERHRTYVMEAGAGPNGLKLLSELYRRPLVNVSYLAARLDVSFPTANRLVSRFEELGLLREITGQRRSRIYRYEPYLALFDEPTPAAGQAVPVEVTEAS
ncbi:Fic family protein [Baekduia sp. Peel2402]|uniref:Fic family protein n=1 Tax=Baekduia sp. Peel2402 TaxID=3458296 RepID=UPI00403E53DB